MRVRKLVNLYKFINGVEMQNLSEEKFGHMDDVNLKQYELFQEYQQRDEEESQDVTEAIVPPPDIVAFTEQRSCADIFRMYDKGQLDINPDFQRGEVWTNRSQTLFIDSLMKQLPIPSMCISLDIKTQKRLVIDGLQRITSIVKFLNPKETWKLAKVDDADDRISGKTTAKIRLNNNEIYDIVENVTIPITVLRCDYSNDNHMRYLFQIFYRLNSGGNKLYNQEIRNCIFQGDFNDLLKSLVRTELWLKFANTSIEKVDKARFANEERLLRFYAFYNNYASYSGRLASFLNDYMNANKILSEEMIRRFQQLFVDTMGVATLLNTTVDSKNVADAVLVGIAKNIDSLKSKQPEDINRLYCELMAEPEFSAEGLQDGLGSTEKVKGRILKSIEVFNRG